MSMYRVAHRTNINGVDVPYFKCLRGSNSLEGFHKTLPHMIPGPHCAARPYQVNLISGIARWNSDCSSDAVFGGKGRNLRSYSAPLIEHHNTRCQQLFGETVEKNFRATAAVTSNELLGLEYLFSQSTGESVGFSLSDLSKDGPVQRRKWFSLTSLTPMRMTRPTRATQRLTRTGRMPVARTRCLDSSSWKTSVLCLWRLARLRIS